VELFAAFALLWRHRLLVLIGAVLAVAAGWKLMQGETTHIGVASARVMLDTPTSQLADSAPLGADTLIGRAQVLADLAETEEITSGITRRMRIDGQDLIVKAPYLSAPRVGTPLPTKALEAAAAAPSRYALSIEAVPDLPILAVDASAPNGRDAKRLATAAIESLQAEVAARQGEPEIQKYGVHVLTPVRAREVTSGPRRMRGAAAAVLLFAFWCFGVMTLAASIRSLRYRRAAMPAVAAER
jgi:hypothetical protein